MANVELENGRHLKHGEYRIERVLGQGGFGITYEAEQVSLGRKVAVKEFFMKNSCEREDGTSRVTVPTSGNRELVNKFKDKFIREARMLAGFKHQSIVKVFDVFEENGTAYYVMEYLEGGSLLNQVRQHGKLSEPRALEYIRAISDALGYIHSKNTLHLDVKPGNIMLDADGSAVLIDFGISKHIDSEGHLTSATPMCVSKGYAPFEQVSQEPGSRYTPATDIYSLGATLYYLLTGNTPYEPSAILDGLPTGELESAGVSRRTIEAISSAMQVRKKDRPQSAAEFVQFLSGTSTKAKSADRTFVSDEETRLVTPAPRQNPVPQTAPQPKPAPKPTSAPQPKGLPKWLIGVLSGLSVIIGIILLAGRRGSESVSFATGINNGHEYVDLGLSVKWATCNVGSTSPEGYGSYFAWGETSPKSEYSWDNLKYCNDTTRYSFSKYNQNEGGTKDNKTVLDLTDDAARANWGGSWRMPTIAEFQELIDKCTWTWTKVNGKKGYKVVSKSNGNSIFLPAAGWRYGTSLAVAGSYGLYWSSSLNESYSYYARFLSFDSDGHDTYNNYRYDGHSVRPVFR